MEEYNIAAKPREAGGKGPARQIRMTGRIPGVFYYRGDQNIPLSVNAKELYKLIKSKPTLINLTIDNSKPYECIFREIQRDPVEDDIMHFDLMGIKRGQKINVTVPVKLVGTPEGVTTGGGILQLSLSELDIICLPKDIPNIIEINVEHLEIGSSISIGEIDFPDFEFQQDEQDAIASVVPPSKVEEPVVEEEEDEEGEEGEEVEEGEGEEGEETEKESE